MQNRQIKYHMLTIHERINIKSQMNKPTKSKIKHWRNYNISLVFEYDLRK